MRARAIAPHLLVVLLVGGLGAVWSLMAPPLMGADEDRHFDYAVRMSRDPTPAVVGAVERFRASRAFYLRFYGVNRVEVMGAPQPPLSSDDHPIEIGLGDLHVRAEAIHMAQHPPLWYWIAGALDRGAGTGDDDDLRLRSQRFRWLNVTFLVAAAVLTVEAGRRIGLSPAAAMLAAVIPALSPRWMWSGATANNDTILVALTAVLILLIARGEMFAGTWQVVAGGLALGFALLSKVFALALIGWLICVSLRRSWRGREWSALRRTGVVITLGMIVGGWWWLRNLMVYGRLQPRTRPATVDPGFEPSLIEFGRDFTVRFIESSWLTLGGTGGLGVPFGAALAGSVVVVGMFAVGLARAGARRGIAVDLATLPILVMVGLLAGGWSSYLIRGVVRTHGRYAFFALTGLAVVAAMAVDRTRWERRALSAVIAVVVAVSVAVLIWVTSSVHQVDPSGVVATAAEWGALGRAGGTVAIVACSSVVLVGWVAAWQVVGRWAWPNPPDPHECDSGDRL